ncbi:hypothetical protein [Clostridium intestinale]|uniref:SinR family protein n=1 Tax=Clostridium intestinale URNW TaxID=1294142 RepID=U2PVK8_9CLOT|nr:hypothetical protein [Clostridium intestinale]ERK30475.1 hypothetical protein CINTURNW_1658 [Clostridium intestinale URNW]
MVYLISYDLNSPGKNYSNLYAVIEEFHDYLHPLDSTWLVSTSLSAKQIYEKLSKTLDSNDKILITKVSDQWHGYLSQKDYDWLFSFVAK